MKLRIHRLAVAEIDHEVDYYESRHAGLGAELEHEIENAFELILRFPEAAPLSKTRADRRVMALDRFPFMLPYQIAGDEIAVAPSECAGATTSVCRKPSAVCVGTTCAAASASSGENWAHGRHIRIIVGGHVLAEARDQLLAVTTIGARQRHQIHHRRVRRHE